MSDNSYTKVSFAKGRNAFQSDLKKRVDAYFKDNGTSRNGNALMAFKTFFWFSVTAAFLCGILFGDRIFGHWDLAYTLTCFFALGFSVACIGFNIGHDAIHGSMSKHKWVNAILAWSFDVVGANAYTWSIQHNFRHHTYTNIRGGDSDIEPGPFLRLYPRSEGISAVHRFQHFYAWFLYCFTTLAWVFQKDWVQIFSVDPRNGRHPRAQEYLRLLVGKTCHFTLFLVLPVVMTPFPWWQVAAGYVLANMVAGLTLAVVFQMAHVVEGPEFPIPDENNRMEMGWAEHQLYTTANFGDANPLITFVVGGLDHQVEHHLFPKICHVHYNALSPIVRSCAADHGLPYIENKSFFGAIASHARALKLCGRPETALAAIERQKEAQAARRRLKPAAA